MGHLTDLQSKGNGLAMGSFGERLRREREMRGVTLEEISESTKISRRHLEALESEHFDLLPGGVFNKGFVRAYTRYLGMDEDQAVADYVVASNEQPPAENQFPLEVRDEPDPELNPRRSHLPLIFAIAALVGVLTGYAFWAKSRPHPAEAAAKVSATAPKSASDQPAPANTPSGTVHNAVQPSAPLAAGPALEAKLAAAERAVASPAAVTAVKHNAAAADATKKTAAHTFFVVVKAKEDSWVLITADGKIMMQKVLRADKQKLVKAGKQIVLRTGNAGGIEVSYNGTPLGAIGNENEPRTLIFTASGRVQ